MNTRISQKQFPHLSEKEKKLILSFCEDLSSPEPILELIRYFFGRFVVSKNRRWRDLYRDKLMDLAGINQLIPANLLYGTIPQLFMPLNKFISSDISNESEGEYEPAAFIRHERFSYWCNLHVDTSTKLKDLLLAKDSSDSPHISSVVLRPTLSSKRSDITELSASTESITATIFLSSESHGSMRDPVSMMFDLTKQADYLIHVRKETGLIVKDIARVRMHVRGAIFALEAFNLIYEGAEKRGELLIDKGCLTLVKQDAAVLDIARYLLYIKKELIDPSIQSIFREGNLDVSDTDHIMHKISAIREYHALKLGWSNDLFET
jgi:hypothetical protein